MSGVSLLRFAACRGIDASHPAAHLSHDQKTGSYHVPRAVNVDVAPGGGVRRRTGFCRVAAGAFHSLWSDGSGMAYAGEGGRLVRLVPQTGGEHGVAIETLATGLTPGAMLSFLAVDGCVYFANGHEKGIIADGVAGPWGPDGDIAPSYDLVAPPAGHLLERHAGRLFLAMEDTVFFTRGAGAFHLMDPAGGFLPRRGGRVRLLAAVADGLFVGTDREVFFAAGHDPAEFAYRCVMDVPPIPGTCLRGMGESLGRVAGRDIPGAAVVWADAFGLCLGGSGGAVTRLAELPLHGFGHGAAVAGRSSLLFVFRA